MSKLLRVPRALPILLSGTASLIATACIPPDEPASEALERMPAELVEQTAHLGEGDAAAAPGVPSRTFMPGELVIKLDPSAELLTYRTTELGGMPVMPIEQLRSGTWHVLLPAVAAAHAAISTGKPIDDLALAAAEQLTLDARDTIAKSPGVLHAHLNGYLEYSSVLEPSDPFYVYQRWNYEAVRLPEAWGHFGGGSADVRLAIIDSETSQNQHPDLVGKWGDSASFTSTPQTYHHGAHVAGIAGAAANGQMGVGVCWDCRLLPYRTNTTRSQIAQAINRAAGDPSLPPRADVINLSMNVQKRDTPNETVRMTCGDDEALAIRDAIAHAISRGVIVVVSAGNFGQHAQDGVGPAFPADCPGVISVAAIQPGGSLASYSNRGAGVTLTAPGGGGDGTSRYGSWLAEMPCAPPRGTDPFNGTAGVVGPFAHYQDPIASNGYCYRYLSGTSMSAPHVTGTVGLMRSQNVGLSPEHAKDILIRTAQPATACPAGLCGAGLLNAAAAVRYAPDSGVPIGSLSAGSFGNVFIGAQAQMSAQLGNTGSAILVGGSGGPMQILGGNGQIEFAYPNGACTSGTSCSELTQVVMAASRSIPLRCRPNSAGLITASLQVPSNRFDSSTGAFDVPLSVALTCVGVNPTPDVTVTPTALGFSSTEVGTTTTARTITVRNAGGGTLAVTASESSTDYALTCQSGCSCAGGSCSASLTANQSAVLAVTFTPQAIGARNAILTIATPGDPDEPSTDVTLSGTGLTNIPDVAVFPGSLGFPVTPVGSTTAPQTFNVRNAGGGTLAVTASETSAEYTLTCLSNCNCAGASCNASLTANQIAFFNVTFSPQAAWARNATLTVVTPGDPDEPSSNVLLFGNGIAPVIEVSPSPWNVGAVLTGSTGTLGGLLRNLGNGAMNVSQLSLTGASAGIFSFTCGGQPCALPLTIAPSSSHALELHCTPTHATAYTAQLVITSNTPGSPHSTTVQCLGAHPGTDPQPPVEM